MTGAIQRLLGAAGLRLVRIPRGQTIPTDLPDPACYGRPQDHSRLYRPWDEPAFRAALHAEILGRTMLSPMKLYYLAALLRTALHAPGDVFEAGAGSGGSARLLLDVLRAHPARAGRRLWTLDTFAGYAGTDPARDGSHVRDGYMRLASSDEVRRLLDQPDVEVRVVPGRIPESLREVDAPRIAFAHIDVNLHEPTRAATEFCLARMPAGGVIVFDDYNWPATFGARRAIDEAARAHGQQVVALAESTQAFLVRT